MATGIVSIAIDDQGFRSIATALLVVNAVAYALLWIVGAVRLARHAQALRRELGEHVAGPAFLTIVAATAVLGAQVARLGTCRRSPPRPGSSRSCRGSA